MKYISIKINATFFVFLDDFDKASRIFFFFLTKPSFGYYTFTILFLDDALLLLDDALLLLDDALLLVLHFFSLSH